MQFEDDDWLQSPTFVPDLLKQTVSLRLPTQFIWAELLPHHCPHAVES